MKDSGYTNNQHMRAKWHDYKAPGYYMLTMVTEGRVGYFGEIKGENAKTAHVELSALGKALEACIDHLHDDCPEVVVIDRVVMPNHCHIQIQVLEKMQRHLGAVVGMIKKHTTNAYLHQLNMQELCLHVLEPKDKRDKKRQRARILTALKENGVEGYENIPIERPERTGLIKEVGEIIRCRVGKGSAVVNRTEVKAGVEVKVVRALWEQGYHDRIVMRHGQIANQKKYIRENPVRAWMKLHTASMYKMHGLMKVPLPYALAVKLKEHAIWWDDRREVLHSAYSERKHYSDSYVELLGKCLLKHRNDGAPYLHFSAYGNTSLLSCGRPIVQVRISRSLKGDALMAEINRLLTLCETEGAILVSPFISDGEQITKLLAKYNGYDIIQMHLDAMSDLWHPMHTDNDRLITQLALVHTDIADDETYSLEGHMLTLAPWADRPTSERPNKPDMEMGNKICEIIAELSDM